MIQHTTAQALGQARLAEMHHQAQRDTLARTARQARRARRQQSGHRAPGVLAAATAWARRSRPIPESALWHPARRIGILGCVSQMAEELGDHPDAAFRAHAVDLPARH